MFHQHCSKAWSSQSMRRGGLAGTGWAPGCSALTLVSTWLCPLFASQRAAEWRSIETNSLCRTQLIGLPRLERRGATVGLWLLILLQKHGRNLPPGIYPAAIVSLPLFKPISFFCIQWYKYFQLPQVRMGDRAVSNVCLQSIHLEWASNGECAGVFSQLAILGPADAGECDVVQQ